MKLRKPYGSLSEILRGNPESLADNGRGPESLADPVRRQVDPNYIEKLSAALEAYDPGSKKAHELARKYMPKE